ncbi:MAG: PDZ domain-containing protein [Woeseiaceae bacterium]|nr:PDZ domain-containing protein [Woeseiaceae bacterium]
MAESPAGTLVSVVHAGSPAEQAGIAPGDEIVALDDIRLTAATFDQRLREYSAGDKVTVTVFRRDELLTFKAKLEATPENTAYLTLDDDSDSIALQKRQAWLTGETP